MREVGGLEMEQCASSVTPTFLSASLESRRLENRRYVSPTFQSARWQAATRRLENRRYVMPTIVLIPFDRAEDFFGIRAICPAE